MKALNTIIKILAALAAVAGAVYIVATYGEQIVAWAKKALSALPKCPCCHTDTVEAEAFQSADVPAQEPVAEEPAPVETAEPEVAPIVDEPAPEVVVAAHEPVAEDADFAE